MTLNDHDIIMMTISLLSLAHVFAFTSAGFKRFGGHRFILCGCEKPQDFTIPSSLLETSDSLQEMSPGNISCWGELYGFFFTEDFH